jgi:hypothetical protein
MKKNGFTGAAILIAAGCFLPIPGSASTLFTLSNAPSSGSFSAGVVTINYDSLTINGNTTSGTFVETYTNSTGLLSLTGKDTAASLPSTVTLFQIQENMNLASTGATFNLYTGATSTINWSSQFLTDLGLAPSPAPTPASVLADSFGVTTNAGGTVTSATLSMSLQTPEPSTLAMLGLALSAALCFPARRRLKFSR